MVGGLAWCVPGGLPPRLSCLLLPGGRPWWPACLQSPSAINMPRRAPCGRCRRHQAS